MLRDAGATLVILGHSERRSGWGETDVLVARKVEAALRAGLEPIVCVGETRDQRQAGDARSPWSSAQTTSSLPEGLAGKAFSVAYEPVWAIGSGLTPTLSEIEKVHGAVRQVLRDRFGEAGGDVPILYGGSVKPSNASEILRASEVGGALVGGASLKAADFLAIVRALLLETAQKKGSYILDGEDSSSDLSSDSRRSSIVSFTAMIEAGVTELREQFFGASPWPTWSTRSPGHGDRAAGVTARVILLRRACLP